MTAAPAAAAAKPSPAGVRPPAAKAKPKAQLTPRKAAAALAAAPAVAPAASSALSAAGASVALRPVESAESLEDGDAALLDFEEDATAAGGADYTEDDFDKEMLDMEAMLATS